MDKLINRIPGECLLVSSLPGWALKMHVESLGKPCDVNKRSQSHLISKDFHLVFTIQSTLDTSNFKGLNKICLVISSSR